jgi:uncharacterized membrane protein YkvA (DUF1232 family)
MLLDLDRNSFSESSFFSKLAEVGTAAREPLVLLYLLLQDYDTPGWAKAAILAAFGVLLSPPSLLFDCLPFGLAVDVVAIHALLYALDDFITEDMRHKAKNWT